MKDELLAYVSEAQKAGLKPQEITGALLAAGWRMENLVSALMSMAALRPLAMAEPAVLRVDEVSKIYGNGDGRTAALQEATLAILRGERIAIIGKSGSGKSTLMHILATLDRPTVGQLHIDGKPVAGLRQAELDLIRNRKFGFVFQQFFLNARSSCLDNVVLPLAIMGVPVDQRRRRGREILEAVGLADKASQRAGNLSGGQKQRLCIARALITEPEVVFADEPTGNLDSESGRQVIDLLFRLQKERGLTLVVVTHDDELAALCDRIITLRDGRII